MIIPVLISIRSIAHRDEGAEDEAITILTSGTLALHNEQSATICYEETLDESMPPQTVEITIEDDCATMQRGGDYSTSMVFRKDCRYEGEYHTPFGDMELAVFCTRLNCQLGPDGGLIRLRYQLDLNGRFAAVHEMELTLVKQSDE